jgi:predicted Zn-dependent protease
MSGGLPPAAEVVERALAAAKGSDGAVVIVEDASEAELRFALNTTTTNGLRRRRTVTVITLREKDGGVAAGVVSRSGAVDPEELVQASEAEAASAAPAGDASPLLTAAEAGDDDDFADGPVLNDLGAIESVVHGLADAFGHARDRELVLAGFAEHWSVTTYLGTSTGVGGTCSRPASWSWSPAPPTGARPRGRGSARRISGRPRSGPSPTAWHSGWRGLSARSTCRRGATRCCCRRTRWRT